MGFDTRFAGNVALHRPGTFLQEDPVLWQAVELGDASFIAGFLGKVAVSRVPREVDFGRSRGNYEERIYTDGILPIRRGSLHDYYNLLAWAYFPRSKVAINQIHHEGLGSGSQAPAGEKPGRGARRDFLTILDEAGVILLARRGCDGDGLASEIRKIRQHAAEEDYSPAVVHALDQAGVSIHVVGHALMEMARTQPGRMAAVGAFAVILPVARDDEDLSLCSLADVELSRFLLANRDRLHPALFPSLRLDVVFEWVKRS